MGPFKPQVIVGLDFANSFLLREDRTRCSTKTDAKREQATTKWEAAGVQ